MNPRSTRTTYGCIRRCPFCGIGKQLIEPGPFRELEDWPDLPIVCDNNLLAASRKHFDRVIDRLKAHGWADFNQGLDMRLLTDYHARRIKEIKEPMVRLALDAPGGNAKAQWLRAFRKLRKARIVKSNIKSYVLVGLETDPGEAWERCEWIHSLGVDPLPRWYHRLDELNHNTVTDEQKNWGWDPERKDRESLFKWYYQRIDVYGGRKKWLK